MGKTENQSKDNIQIKPHSYIFNILVNIFLNALFGIWSSLIFPYISNSMGFVVSDKLTTTGYIVVGIVSLSYLSALLIYNIYEYRNTKVIQSTDYHKLTNSNNELKNIIEAQRADLHFDNDVIFALGCNCDEKTKTLCIVINNIIRTNKNIYFSKIISSPENQIYHILQNMSTMLSDLCSIDKNHFSITACVRISDKDWQWINGCQPHGVIDLNNLLTGKSMFNTLSSPSERYLFYNNKETAAANGLYIPDGEDDKGSIIGRKIVLKTSNLVKYIEFMYFISTYNGNLIVESDDKTEILHTKTLLSERLFSVIDKRLDIELMLFFINSYQP